MSRQSKQRNKRRARLAAKLSRPAKPHLTPQQRALRREQARILFEAQVAEKMRKQREEHDRRQAEIRKAEKKRERQRDAKERTRRQRSKNFSQTSGAPLAVKKVEVTPSGTVLRLAATTVISRKGVHVKTYEGPDVQVKFLGDGKRAVVIFDMSKPPRMLDLETGQDREIEPELPQDATALISATIISTPTSTRGA